MSGVNSVRKNRIDAGVVYKGWVIDNDDSKHPDGVKAGRVRVKVKGVLDNLESDDHYPWAVPDWAQADGSTQHSGMFDVPKVNAIVNVRFLAAPDGSGSVYHPVYTSTHAYKQQVLRDAEWHYPNRKVHRLSNGHAVVVDTKDDSVHFYNPGETHLKSQGKLTIKCEETMVIISDVEIGLRAPEIALRAKDHLILESEGLLTMRSKGKMNIESRDDIFMLARQNIDVQAVNEQIRVQTRCEGANGDVLVRSAADKVHILAEGTKGRTSNVEIDSAQDSILLTAPGKERKSEIKAKSHDNLELESTDKDMKLTTSNIKGPPTKIDIIAMDGNITTNAMMVTGGGLSNVLAAKIITIAAPEIIMSSD